MKNPNISRMTGYAIKVFTALPEDKVRFFKPLAISTQWSVTLQIQWVTGMLIGWEVFDLSVEQGVDLMTRVMENLNKDLENEAIQKG